MVYHFVYQTDDGTAWLWWNGISRRRRNRVYDWSRVVWPRKDETLYAFDLSFICYRRKCIALLYDIILCNHEIKIGGLKW